MATAMPPDPVHQKIIRDHAAKQEKDAGGKDSLPSAKLIVKGRAQQAPIYRFDTYELAFNKANGRIHAEVLEKEAKLGHDLDIGNVEDQKIIKELLLSIRPDENEKIKETEGVQL